jgi:hypothetical protein
MSSATIAIPHSLASERAGHDLLSYWVERCDQFLDRQRKNILERDASPKELADHIDALKFMIRATLCFQVLFADPDFPAQQFGPKIAGKLLQLQESLKLLQNPTIDAEADAILQAAFPNGSRTGSPA